MRHFILYTYVALSVLLIGCSGDGLMFVDSDDHVAYMQVVVSREDLSSRTVGVPTMPGTEQENAIDDLTLYLVNGSDVVKKEGIGVLSVSSGEYISELIEIDESMLNREYQVFVVANSDKAGLDLRDTQDFKSKYQSANAGELTTPGQMVMSNNVEQSPAPTIEITIGNSLTNPARVMVMLDRLAVKIVPMAFADFRADFTGRDREEVFFDGYSFSVEGAGLLNAATEFNLEQQWSAGAPVQLLSPTWEYQPTQHFFDKYYNPIGDYDEEATAPFVAFAGIVNDDGYYPILSPLYCLENNSPLYDYAGSGIAPEDQLETKYRGLATGVVFKIQAVEGGVPATFYRYRAQYYSDTESGRQELSAAAGLIQSDFNDVSVLRGKAVEVYQDGMIYYTYWIKDNNYDLNYAVVRNSVYTLRVNSLTRIGNDTPGGKYTPEDSIDKLEQLEIVAESQDWTLIEVTHDFN